MRWRAALPLGFLVLALVPASASAAIPTRTLSCGEVITASVRLASDVTCQADFNTDFFGPALRVAADDVTLDLGGHTVTMNSTQSLRSPGVVAVGARVTIRNGTVDAGGTAVELSGDYGRVVDLQATGREGISAGGTGVRIARNTVNAGFGISAGGPDLRITDNSVTGAIAIQVSGAPGGVIARNSVRASTAPAIWLNQTDGTRVVDNQVTAGDDGVWVYSGSGNVVASNFVIGEGRDTTNGDGIVVYEEATGTIVRENLVAEHGGDGIQVNSPLTRVAHNAAFYNGLLGIRAVPGTTSGPGNIAGGNGDPRQCLNVACN